MLLTLYPNVVLGLAIFMIGVLVGAWLLSAYISWCERLGQLGCDDPSEPVDYIDHDGEATYGRHSWRHAGVKARMSNAGG